MADKKQTKKKNANPRRDKNFTGFDTTTFKDKVYIGRYSKGNLVEKHPKTKTYTKETARNNYSENKSIIPGKAINTLTNVREITMWGNKVRKPSRGSYQYIVRIVLKVNNKPVTITARSQSHPADHPKELAKDEAWTSVYERISQHFGGAYDKGIGMSKLKNYDYTAKEGVVWYQKR